MRRGQGEDGLTATQLAVVMPALLFWIMLIVQYGLWFHAKQVVGAAAAEAIDVAQVPGHTPAQAEKAARSFLAQSGNVQQVVVAVEPGADTVTVQVAGLAPRLVPGITWRVASVARAPLEEFIPENER